MPAQEKTNPPTITLATSIAPASDLLNQLKAISSWLDLGFKVIAVNTPEEIQIFQTIFPGVRFIPALRSASARYGRSYIFFDDLLHCLSEFGSEICGIVNSDIHLSAPALPVFAGKEAENAFLFGSRVDISSLEARDQGEWYDGFDYFFFPRKIIAYYPQEGFCIGLPWWDFWAVFIPLQRGIKVKKLISPVAYHIKHTPGHLYTGSWVDLGYTFAKYVPPPFPLSTESMPAYINFALDWLVSKTYKITLPKQQSLTSSTGSQTGVNQGNAAMRGHGDD